MTDQHGQEVKLITYLWERFGVTAIVLAVALSAFGTFAKWTREDFTKLNQERREDQQAFLTALTRLTAAVENLHSEQSNTNTRLWYIERTLGLDQPNMSARPPNRRLPVASALNTETTRANSSPSPPRPVR